jgi:hypothetical protein
MLSLPPLESGTIAASSSDICSASVSIRQHTSAYVSIRQHPSASVSIRQHLHPTSAEHTSAYVSTRQHTSASVSIHQHTSAYVSIRQHLHPTSAEHTLQSASAYATAYAYVSIRHVCSKRKRMRSSDICRNRSMRAYASTREHTRAYAYLEEALHSGTRVFRLCASIREHTRAYASIRIPGGSAPFWHSSVQAPDPRSRGGEGVRGPTVAATSAPPMR